MSVLIRVDASVEIGLGHAKRCLALAEGLTAYFNSITILYHQMPKLMRQEFESKGICCQSLGIKQWSETTDAKATKVIIKEQGEFPLLIVDHYLLGIDWEKMLRPMVRGMIVIDDWGDRKHDCDILIDQNLCDDPDQRYKRLLPDYCKRLIGHEYAILNQDILNLKEKRSVSKRGLISFGGSYHPEVKKVLKAVSMIKLDWEWDLILGMISDEDYEDVMKLVPDHVNVHCYVDNMHDFLIKAKLCIGASGSSNWERFYLGIPSIISPLSDDQVPIAEVIQTHDLACVVPESSVSTFLDYQLFIEGFNEYKLCYYSEKTKYLIDGKGIERICQAIQIL